jgi:hypothetical protein
LLLFVDRVIALFNPVAVENALSDSRRAIGNFAQILLHLVIINWFSRQKLSNPIDISTVHRVNL